MSSAGLSKSRLERMHHVLSGYVEGHEVPGLVALVSRHDDVHVETLGAMAYGDPAPMRRDTIFRIASITKLITAVAAMILVEECKLRLDESIEPWLPELANRRVLKSVSSPLDDTVPARRAITVRDLLMYRMDFGSEQILSRAAVELMTADHLTPEQRAGSEIFFGAYSSWGFGMAVDIRRDDIFHTPGRFGWDGAFGTTAYTDPAEGLIGILFTQRMMDSPEPPTVFTDFWTLAYGAME
jgi:CubicO group peptidase (beta-lactamase class C family)